MVVIKEEIWLPVISNSPNDTEDFTRANSWVTVGLLVYTGYFVPLLSPRFVVYDDPEVSLTLLAEASRLAKGELENRNTKHRSSSFATFISFVLVYGPTDLHRV